MMLDPETIRLSRHVIDRYMERRGWPTADAIGRLDAEYCIRQLLQRVADQHPPLMVVGGHSPARRFRHGGMTWITDANCTVLVTFIAEGRKSGARNRSHKRRGISA